MKGQQWHIGHTSLLLPNRSSTTAGAVASRNSAVVQSNEDIQMRHFLTATAATLFIGFASSAAHAGCTGPSSLPVMTVKTLKATGKDDQYVILRGKIVSGLGDERYLFSDGTGQLRVKIEADVWPAQQPVDAQTTVELEGEYDKEMVGHSEFEVKQIRLP